MKWIRQFQLVLFDFDGLLVNTEHLHYQAYINMMARRGYQLDWTFDRFCMLAHVGGSALRDELYNEYPDLDPAWETLYGEKREIYLALLEGGKVGLMPGAERLLKELAHHAIRHCIVTHALREHIELISAYLSILKNIPCVTREDYAAPKPNPECYLRAISLYGHEGDRIVGFEDSLRGLRALKQTPAQPVLICAPHYPLMDMALQETGALHFESLEAILTV